MQGASREWEVEADMEVDAEAEAEVGGVPLTAPENTPRYPLVPLSHALAPIPVVLQHALYSR